MNFKKASVLTFAILIGFTLFIAQGNPFKIRDPLTPKYDVGSFKFEDYKTTDELSYALKNLLPLGTSKDEADKILVQIGGATIQEIPDKHMSTFYKEYIYKRKIAFTLTPNNFIKIGIKYNPASKLGYLSVNGKSVHPYPNNWITLKMLH